MQAVAEAELGLDLGVLQDVAGHRAPRGQCLLSGIAAQA